MIADSNPRLDTKCKPTRYSASQFEGYLKGMREIPDEKMDYLIQNVQIIAYENVDPAIEAMGLIWMPP